MNTNTSIAKRNATMQNFAMKAPDKHAAMQTLARRYNLSARQVRHIVNYQDFRTGGVFTLLESVLDPSSPLAMSAVKSYRENMDYCEYLIHAVRDGLQTPFQEPREATLWHYGEERYVALANHTGLLAICIVCSSKSALYVEHAPRPLFVTMNYRAKAMGLILAAKDMMAKRSAAKMAKAEVPA